jgi:hypothetical protein
MQYIIITGIDSNPVNQQSLRMLFVSLLKNSFSYSKFFVVFPSGSVSQFMQDELKDLGANLYSREFDNSSDPYRAKLMLCDFLQELKPTNEYILYIDSDHVINGDLLNIPQNDSVQVSSEVQKIFLREDNDLSNLHFNTSLIYSKYENLLPILKIWSDSYSSLSGKVSLRYLEEIAFSKAAFLSKISLCPVDLSIQSGFHARCPGWTTFHYGGKYEKAINIKNELLVKYNERINSKTSSNIEKEYEDFLNIFYNQF